MSRTTNRVCAARHAEHLPQHAVERRVAGGVEPVQVIDVVDGSFVSLDGEEDGGVSVVGGVEDAGVGGGSGGLETLLDKG